MTPCTPSLPGGSHQLQPRCLAALADAQDESFLLTRLCDRETFALQICMMESGSNLVCENCRLFQFNFICTNMLFVWTS